MSHLQYTAKFHHLQWNIKQLSKLCYQLYRDYCPEPFKHRRNICLSKVSDQSLNLWFYGFKVYMLVTLSGYILNYVVTSASVHDIRAVEDLLENCHHSYILADLSYLSRELRDHLEQKSYHLWIPLRQNMAGAEQHNHWKLMAMRKTIETRFSELCTLFDMGKHQLEGKQDCNWG